jgi:hypothetical protein
MAEHLGSTLVACLVSYVFVGLAGGRKGDIMAALSIFSLGIAYKEGDFFRDHHPANISVGL